MLRSSPFVTEFGKDTNTHYNGSDSKSCCNITAPELLRFLLPLRELHLSDKVELVPGKVLLVWIYPLCKRDFGIHSRFLVSHFCDSLICLCNTIIGPPDISGFDAKRSFFFYSVSTAISWQNKVLHLKKLTPRTTKSDFFFDLAILFLAS